MQIFKQITDMFGWLEKSGILAALAAFFYAVFKAVMPYLKAHTKNKQMQNLESVALSIVTKFATWVGLSKSDRNKAAIQELVAVAKSAGYTWVTPEIASAVIEVAYQQFKKLGYDNHQPQTSPEPDGSAENSATPQVPASSAAQVAQSSASNPKSAAQPASQAPQTIQSVANSGSDQNA